MDVLSNALSTLLNASRSRRASVLLSASAGGGSRRIRERLRLLTREGYLGGLSPGRLKAHSQNEVVVHLKYNSRGEPAIRALFRVSTPGRRVYIGVSSLWQPPAGAGLLVLSTPNGLRSDRDARRFNLGGEVLMGIR